MSSSKRSIIARILAWFGLVSAVETKRPEAVETSVAEAHKAARQAAFLSALLQAPAKSRSAGRRSSHLMAARIAAVAKLNGPAQRKARQRRVAPAMKPIPKKVEIKKVSARRKAAAAPARILLAPKLPAPRKSAEIITFKPRRTVRLDRAA